ncbi:cellulase family glycosylhydrolase [Stenotrophobium rhamnosiphilum]|uniref:Endoglycoceramidase n=1 Tax=Stenotrophobium rhamnosiphilum TaxID=2029166 RepID=A0A2T5MEG1_9GAMM|nr:cellulase family glycosylhydrolase [Stenotrophobium rhamnosiphilum]PTU30942.1 endoglycoceramidase [Stenotrophobium rhamnosiphilum]
MKRFLFLIVALVGLGIAWLKWPQASVLDAVLPAESTMQPSPVAVREQLRHLDGWLVDRQGRVVILHGVNAVWKIAPYSPPDSAQGFTAQDADWLVAHGFNVVRLGVLFAGVMPDKGQINQDYLDKIDRIVKLLASRKIYVMLDFHQDLYGSAYLGEGFPAWTVRPSRFDDVLKAGFPLGYVTPRVSIAFDRFWNNEDGMHDHFRDAWMAVATRWKDQDYLMGYDIINEPWSGSVWPVCARPMGCADFENNKLQPFYEHVLKGIREVDPYNIVWIEPQVLFEFGAQSHLGSRPIADEQLGLSWHNYCIAAPMMKAYGIKAATCARLGERVDKNAVKLAARLRSATLLSEFGASDDTVEIARITANADRNLVGWTYWSYKNWGDPTTQAQGSGAQSIFTSDVDFNSAKNAKLSILERPYPQAVAGVPIAFNFDAAERVFTLTYSTTMLTGIASPTAVLTQIYVPTLHFPRGYVVDIQGGRVVSEANAARLLIAAEAGADQVEVRISELETEQVLEN